MNGRPKIGEQVEFIDRGGWKECTVVAHHGLCEYLVFVERGDNFSNGKDFECANVNMQLRPIRTKEQRLRDELANAISEAMIDSAQEHSMPEASDIADSILSLYNLEPKP